MISWTFKTKMPFAPSWFNEKWNWSKKRVFEKKHLQILSNSGMGFFRNVFSILFPESIVWYILMGARFFSLNSFLMHVSHPDKMINKSSYYTFDQHIIYRCFNHLPHDGKCPYIYHTQIIISTPPISISTRQPLSAAPRSHHPSFPALRQGSLFGVRRSFSLGSDVNVPPPPKKNGGNLGIY